MKKGPHRKWTILTFVHDHKQPCLACRGRKVGLGNGCVPVGIVKFISIADKVDVTRLTAVFGGQFLENRVDSVCRFQFENK